MSEEESRSRQVMRDDLESIHRAIALARGIVGKWRYAGDREVVIRGEDDSRLIQIVSEPLHTLTQRIAELQKENKRLKELLMHNTMVTCIHHNDEQRKNARCPVCAEARVKELEARLGAALKVE